jgi:hypothetical protein
VWGREIGVAHGVNERAGLFDRTSAPSAGVTLQVG